MRLVRWLTIFIILTCIPFTSAYYYSYLFQPFIIQRIEETLRTAEVQHSKKKKKRKEEEKKYCTALQLCITLLYLLLTM